MKKIFTMALMLLAVATLSLAAAQPQLPKGYTGWKKSERKVINDKKSIFYGIHYIYANPKAMKGYNDANKFPEGSQIIIEHFNIKDTPSGPAEGAKNMIVMMKKDKSQKATEGWLYAGFTAQGKPSGLDPVKNCFECHKKEASMRNYVFSGIGDFK